MTKLIVPQKCKDQKKKKKKKWNYFHYNDALSQNYKTTIIYVFRNTEKEKGKRKKKEFIVYKKFLQYLYILF